VVLRKVVILQSLKTITLKHLEIMTLTAKEIATLELLNKKGLVYEYVEVQALGANGMTTMNKLVKIGSKVINTKVNTANTSEVSSLSMAQIEDANELRRQQARKNNL